jgi:hypothetical protein
LPKLAALGTALAGVINLASAVTPNIGWRHHVLLQFAPFEALRLSHAALLRIQRGMAHCADVCSGPDVDPILVVQDRIGCRIRSMGDSVLRVVAPSREIVGRRRLKSATRDAADCARSATLAGSALLCGSGWLAAPRARARRSRPRNGCSTLWQRPIDFR